MQREANQPLDSLREAAISLSTYAKSHYSIHIDHNTMLSVLLAEGHGCLSPNEYQQKLDIEALRAESDGRDPIEVVQTWIAQHIAEFVSKRVGDSRAVMDCVMTLIWRRNTFSDGSYDAAQGLIDYLKLRLRPTTIESIMTKAQSSVLDDNENAFNVSLELAAWSFVNALRDAIQLAREDLLGYCLENDIYVAGVYDCSAYLTAIESALQKVTWIKSI
jgi:hypothetical protein